MWKSSDCRANPHLKWGRLRVCWAASPTKLIQSNFPRSVTKIIWAQPKWSHFLIGWFFLDVRCHCFGWQPDVFSRFWGQRVTISTPFVFCWRCYVCWSSVFDLCLRVSLRGASNWLETISWQSLKKMIALLVRVSAALPLTSRSLFFLYRSPRPSRCMCVPDQIEILSTTNRKQIRFFFKLSRSVSTYKWLINSLS